MKYSAIINVMLLFFCTVFNQNVLAQGNTEWQVYDEPKYQIQFPDILGFETLVCDLHSHTVFSDGVVWPTVRVAEALREGLDALVISDHIEYQPHKEDIPTNHNRSYEIASPSARIANILMPRGSEITRDTPPGHYNAIYIVNSNPLDNENFLEQIEEANNQGGFVFWNHHAWKGEERGQWEDVQQTMKDNNWLHGIEVANGDTYYPTAHQYALEHDLTFIGTSDIHQPAYFKSDEIDNHRTTTLVFVTEKTMPALKDALQEGRTAVWYKNQIFGREKYLREMVKEGVTFHPPHHHDGNTWYMEISNSMEVDVELEKTGEHGPDEMTIPAKSTIVLRMRAEEPVSSIDLNFDVTNFLVEPNKPLNVSFQVELD